MENNTEKSGSSAEQILKNKQQPKLTKEQKFNTQITVETYQTLNKALEELAEKVRNIDDKATQSETRFENRLKESVGLSLAILNIVGMLVLTTFIFIAFDYLWNNSIRYEKITDQIQDIRKELYTKDDIDKNFINRGDFYTKEEITTTKIETGRNANILECFKIKQRFSMDCFSQN